MLMISILLVSQEKNLRLYAELPSCKQTFFWDNLYICLLSIFTETQKKFILLTCIMQNSLFFRYCTKGDFVAWMNINCHKTCSCGNLQMVVGLLLFFCFVLIFYIHKEKLSMGHSLWENERSFYIKRWTKCTRWIFIKDTE